MKVLFARIVLPALAVVLIAGCQMAPVVHTQGSVVVGDEHTRITVVFSDHDRRYIHDYYRARYQERQRHEEQHARKKLPPGLAKREQLPPGLDKRETLPPGLSRREHLPPGVHGDPLPSELEHRLARLPAGVSRVRIGAEIVLIDERSRVVLDVIKDIPLE